MKPYGRGELHPSFLLTWNDACRFSYIDRLEDKLEKPAVPERDKIGYKVGKEE